MNPNAVSRATALDLYQALQGASDRLALEPGKTYEVSGEWLPDRDCRVSNNDHGLKRIVLDLDGRDDFTLDGRGARLLCVGEVLPIRVGRCRNVVIKNLVIDWVRPFFTQAVVEEAGPGVVVFGADPRAYPLAADAGRLVALDGRGWQTDDLLNLLAYDPERREMKAGSRENWHLWRSHRATSLGGGRFKLEAAFEESYAPGTPIVLMHGRRAAPGVFIEDSSGVRLENVTVHHAPGMAFIAQLSKDVALEKCRVEPSGERLFSSWVDASHFVDCDGTIRIAGCRFTGQFDDAANIHGTFWKVCARPAANVVRAEIRHRQQRGVKQYRPGDTARLFTRSGMKPLHTTTVVDCRFINETLADVTLASLPDGLEVDDCVIGRYNGGLRVEICDNEFLANRGRGMLLTVPGKVRVENNRFHVSGRAIEIVADSDYWWESGPVEDVVIRGNVFEHCNFAACGATLFHIGPECGRDVAGGVKSSIKTVNALLDAGSGAEPVHGDVRITDNVIVRHSRALLHARQVRSVVFKDNTLRWGDAYARREEGEEVEIGPGVASADVQKTG